MQMDNILPNKLDHYTNLEREYMMNQGKKIYHTLEEIIGKEDSFQVGLIVHILTAALGIAMVNLFHPEMRYIVISEMLHDLCRVDVLNALKLTEVIETIYKKEYFE
jgi:hypothetical protein